MPLNVLRRCRQGISCGNHPTACLAGDNGTCEPVKVAIHTLLHGTPLFTTRVRTGKRTTKEVLAAAASKRILSTPKKDKLQSNAEAGKEMAIPPFVWTWEARFFAAFDAQRGLVSDQTWRKVNLPGGDRAIGRMMRH